MQTTSLEEIIKSWDQMSKDFFTTSSDIIHIATSGKIVLPSTPVVGEEPPVDVLYITKPIPEKWLEVIDYTLRVSRFAEQAATAAEKNHEHPLTRLELEMYIAEMKAAIRKLETSLLYI